VTTEIERRFLVAGLPHDALAGVRMRQGYVALDGTAAVRVREADGEHVLTVKGGQGLMRTEVEFSTDAAQFEALWALTGGRHIDKCRHIVRVGEHTVEVDVFGGTLNGLVIAEVEFESIDAAHAFVPPSWFGREVTDEPLWNNASLALHGRPNEPR
jgi:CYTH domain-containing protein